MIKTKKQIKPQNALLRLEELCSRSEQCTGEARKKLFNWGISQNDSEKIIDSLVSRRYIDDRRFCNAFVRDKLRFSHWGKRKITLALIQKHVDRDIINEAIDNIDENEYLSILKKIVLAKAGTIIDADTYEGRTRLFRFAVSRGFETAPVSRIIRELATSDD